MRSINIDYGDLRRCFMYFFFIRWKNPTFLSSCITHQQKQTIHLSSFRSYLHSFTTRMFILLSWDESFSSYFISFFFCASCLKLTCDCRYKYIQFSLFCHRFYIIAVFHMEQMKRSRNGSSNNDDNYNRKKIQSKRHLIYDFMTSWSFF